MPLLTKIGLSLTGWRQSSGQESVAGCVSPRCVCSGLTAACLRRDASWELVPNAFGELLERHLVCDVRYCLCSQGRSHQENETDRSAVARVTRGERPPPTPRRCSVRDHMRNANYLIV